MYFQIWTSVAPLVTDCCYWFSGSHCWKRRLSHDGRVSPVIWFWYVSTFLNRKPPFGSRHAEVNLCSCRDSLRLENPGDSQRHVWVMRWDASKRGMRAGEWGQRGGGERTRSKYSYKLTKVDTGTDVFDKFPLLWMSKCKPDGGEQRGLARCLVVCAVYRRGALWLIRAEAKAYCRKAPQIPLSLIMIQ